MAASVMTKEDRTAIVLRLIAMQNTLRTLCDDAEEGAAVAKAAGADGLAFATLMLKEALAEYGKAMNKYVLGGLADDEP